MRTVPANATSRTWFRPNPPLPRVNWSLRDNINLQESGLLFAMDYTANNARNVPRKLLSEEQAQRCEAANEGPAAWVVPADDPRPVGAASLMDLLQIQGVEISKTTAESEVTRKRAERSAFPPAAT